MTQVKMYLHEDYNDSEMEEVYAEPWASLGIPLEAALAFVGNRPTYKVGLVLEYRPDSNQFTLVRVEGLDGKDYVVVEGEENVE